VALASEPDHAKALVYKARSLVALLRRDEAVEAARAAARLKPEPTLRTLDTLGVVFSRSGLHTEAVPFYEAATRANPDPANFHYNLGAALQFIGEMDLARNAYEACLERDPRDTRAISAIVQITRQTDEDNEIAQT
jgi:tetratricopeptide (TPR) repeat protein